MTGGAVDDLDTQRLVDEPPKDPAFGDDGRGPFQRDRARVLHSAAFRRLAAKTQVHTTGDDQFVRTRLTHSLEVAQIAREMGSMLGCDPDVVDTAGLAHDLGHPPFGHVGEESLDALAAPCGGFEGNAQTLRVLTRLEAKVCGPSGEPVGLNLTRASLDAVAKYPWPRDNGQRKFGVYRDDQTSTAGSATDARRTVLPGGGHGWADIGVLGARRRGRRPRPPGAARPLRWTRGGGAVPGRRGDVPRESATDLEGVLVELLADEVFEAVDRYDGGHVAQVALKRLTSVLTGRLVAAAVAATRARHGDGPLRRYAADLVVPRTTRAQCALLKGIALRYVMRRPHAATFRPSSRSWRRSGRGAAAAGPGLLSPLRPAVAGADDGAAAGRGRPGGEPHRPGGGGLVPPAGRRDRGPMILPTPARRHTRRRGRM
jgi:dGTPase